MTPTLPFQPTRPWRTHPRETAALGLLTVAGMLAVAGAVGATPTLPELKIGPSVDEVAPPKPLLTDIRALSPETAVAVNAQIPLISGPVPPAQPFVFGNGSAEARARATECLTSAIYYEAGQESTEGQRGVAQVVLNRVRHPAFPNSVCGVVYEGSTRQTGCQFTFTCDGSMARRPVPALWDRARRVAAAALSGEVYAPVGNATHYHANYVVPYWASSLTKTRVEGAHLFYRWAGNWGRPAAFTQRWSTSEANPAALRMAALSVPETAPSAILTAEATEVTKLEANGAKVTKEGGRVRVLFTPQAREAVEKVKVTPYVDRSAASDNLRYALDGGSAPQAAPQQAFGKAPESPKPTQ
ncbi:cell wall hydrolase [Sphingomonas sp. LY29]|uniref:cell wall hydrolase n=1 Tax=Sphingomonas sp. LY29 TaxID=3095341 RepID=UPI002D78354C|nr:cell wall hydrolase [Sphingomonas sp. LY29]WRP25895.1 cell wall hydrolase [Sphingomonas sp. LY29]